MNRVGADDTARELNNMKEQLTGYWNAVGIITANSHAIVKSKLEQVDPSRQPAWLPDLRRNFNNCQNHAQRWIDTVYPELTRIPQAIIDYNRTFEFTSTRISNILALAQTRALTDEDKAQLLRLLKLLLNKLGDSKKEVEAVRAEIKAFSTNMIDDHKALNSGTASIATAVEDASEEVKRLENRIESLRIEVERLRQQIIASGVALGTSIFVAYVGMSIMPFITVPIAIIGIGVSAGFMIDGIVRLNKYQDEILEDGAKLSKEQAQIVVLRSIEGSVNGLVTSIDAINTNIDVVSSTWSTLDTKLGSVIKNIEAASGKNWLDYVKQEIDINTSKRAWSQLNAFAETLQQIKVVNVDKTFPIARVA